MDTYVVVLSKVFTVILPRGQAPTGSVSQPSEQPMDGRVDYPVYPTKKARPPRN